MINGEGSGHRGYSLPLMPEHPSFVELPGDIAEDLAEKVSDTIESIILSGEIPEETSVSKEYKMTGISLDLYPSPYLVQEMNADSLSRRYNFLDINITIAPGAEPDVTLRFYNPTAQNRTGSLLTEPLLLSNDGDGYVFYLESSPFESNDTSPDGVKRYSLSDVISLIESVLSSDPIEINPAETKLTDTGRLILAAARLKNDSLKYTEQDSYKHAWQDDAEKPPFSCVQVEQVLEKKAFMLVDEKEVITVTSTMLEYFKPETDGPEYRAVIAYVFMFERDESGDINYSSSTIDVFDADTNEDFPPKIKRMILCSLTKDESSQDDFKSIIISATTDIFTPLENRDLGE